MAMPAIWCWSLGWSCTVTFSHTVRVRGLLVEFCACTALPAHSRQERPKARAVRVFMASPYRFLWSKSLRGLPLAVDQEHTFCTRLSRLLAKAERHRPASPSVQPARLPWRPGTDPTELKESDMIKRSMGMMALVLAMAGGMAATGSARAADANVDCKLRFNLSGWSIIYKHAEGNGTITCDNGQQATVKIEVVGGGLTAGKY